MTENDVSDQQSCQHAVVAQDGVESSALFLLLVLNACTATASA